jgi:para-aminobenzoate synthetase component 1
MLKYKIFTYINPEQIFALVAKVPGTIFLDSSMEHQHYGRYSFILVNPVREFVATDCHLLEADLARWNDILDQHKSPYNPALPPFTGGLCGYFSYDLAKQLEHIPSSRQNIVPNYHLGLYNQVFAFDHTLQKCFIMVTPFADENCKIMLDNLINLYYQAQKQKMLVKADSLPLVNLKSNYTKIEYMQKVEQVREHILDGDVFEVNLAQCFSTHLNADYPLDLLYMKLRQVNQAPFSAYLNFSKLKLLSASPERFISVRNRHIETRPIKGTISRSNDINEDKHLINMLRYSIKDRAENIMIVDLMRNDLAKICIPGSVMVSSLCEVESFTNVHHLVSVIEGDLETKRSVFDIIPACFPGGSITGAPKIRAMQIIDTLEDSNRGVYCGSIGYFGFNGNVDLSIAIRTFVANDDNLSFHVGGAVTLDSNPEAEYEETLLKAQKMIEAITKA